MRNYPILPCALLCILFVFSTQGRVIGGGTSSIKNKSGWDEKVTIAEIIAAMLCKSCCLKSGQERIKCIQKQCQPSTNPCTSSFKVPTHPYWTKRTMTINTQPLQGAPA